MGQSKSGGKAAAQARADEQARQERVRQGTESINQTFDGQFTPGFFDQRRQAYMDFATPQVDQQHADAQKQLTYSLARSGLLDSSVRGEKTAELSRLYDQNKQQVADKALSSANEAKTSVEGARSDLVSMLNATGDAQGASNSALTRAQALTAPQEFSPLTRLFADFTSGLGQQAALERAAAFSGGMVKPRYDTGLFSPGKSSVQVS